MLPGSPWDAQFQWMALDVNSTRGVISGQPAKMAATNKSLAQSNKCRTGGMPATGAMSRARLKGASKIERELVKPSLQHAFFGHFYTIWGV
jgi:hypothetical protein